MSNFLNPSFETDLANWLAGKLPNDFNANLPLWFDPSKIMGKVDNDPITALADLSPNGNNLASQATPPLYKTGIINGLPIIRFDKTGWLDIANITGLPTGDEPLTIFAIARPHTVTAGDTILDLGTNGTQCHYIFRSGTGRFTWDSYGLNDLADFDAQTLDTPYIMAGRYNPVNSLRMVYTNGNPGASSVQAMLNGDGFQLGYLIGSSLFYDGDLGEVFVIHSTISDADLADLHSYLALKWGLTLTSQGGNITRDTTIYYSGIASAKVVAINDTPFFEEINPGITGQQILTAYAYTDGSPVTNSDVQLMANGLAVTTSFENMGAGWYKMTATVIGGVSNRKYGALVKAGKTVYLDGFDLTVAPDFHKYELYAPITIDHTKVQDTDQVDFPTLISGIFNGQPAVVATGGIITYDGDYKIHTFTANDNFVVSQGGDIEILMVGAGGGGGHGIGAAGGAGEFVHKTVHAVTPQSYAVVIGNGGIGSNNNGANGQNGEDTTFDTLTAKGGGGGGSANLGSGNAGGSGGGGSGNLPAGGGVSTASDGVGNAGGNGGYNFGGQFRGGGGGGAGAVGDDGATSGNGGAGLTSSITGTLQHYAGGGGGGSYLTGGGLGVDGGGNGADYPSTQPVTGGAPNTGGGGGGGSGAGETGGTGGTGIVIIRYRYKNLPDFRTVANGGSLQNANGYDLVFCPNKSFNSKLDYEVEKYDPATGELVAHVRIPNLSHTVDTVIYALYSNPTITTSQENPHGVWDTYYQIVAHMADPTKDSTGKHLLTDNATSPDAGIINGARGMAGGWVYALPSSDWVYGYDDFTWEAWAKHSGAKIDNGIIGICGNPSYYEWMNIGSEGFIMEFNTVSGIAHLDNGGSAIPANEFHHFVAKRNGDNWKILIDGVVVSTQTGHYDVPDLSTNLDIGSLQPGYGSPWNMNGTIDETRLSRGIGRSDGWIKTEYNNQFSPATFYSVGSPLPAIVGPFPTFFR